ncbi:hypothetical protein [Streptomyces sp. NPDC051569]|uniref:hypothetical protein n=1 Tax=Streptomyces sp. NPDC051569 TaxID=3365661 RepID=UPI0037BC02C5
MTRSEARRYLGRLTNALGTDGVLIVPNPTPETEGADLAPGSALKWPPCECGHPKCPDYDPPDPPTENTAPTPR